MNEVTIVMYHYVRPIKDSKFPGIKGLDLEGFRRQLDYFEHNYTFVMAQEVIDAAKNRSKLPKNACWLTFDDGYKDHIKFVMPELVRRGIQGSFFAPSAPILERKVLNVNKVQHILACVSDKSFLLSNLNSECLKRGVSESNLKSYWSQYGKPNRFDSADVIYIKRMLQHALPEEIHNEITSVLFERFVGISGEAFASELYMSRSDISELIKNGMFVGSHGSQHYWLNKLSAEKQKIDIQASLEFLEDVGASTGNWIMCYPYGAYNDKTLEILKKNRCSVGITTELALANLKEFDSLTLPRFDTNDFPQ